MNKTLSVLFSFAALLLLSACKPNPEKDPAFQFEKGFGRSKERPVGAPFNWPAGIRAVADR